MELSAAEFEGFENTQRVKMRVQDTPLSVLPRWHKG